MLALSYRGRKAFTLVEILASCVVLVILVLLVAQVIQSGSLLIAGGKKQLTADAQAREVFSRFDLDLKRMPRRADMDVVLSTSNNTIYFFCEGPAFFSSSSASGNRNTLSLVGYRVNASAQLERLAKGLTWSDPTFLTYTSPKPDPTTVVAESTLVQGWSSVIGTAPGYDNGTDADFHVLADGVFRIYYCFQLQDGTYAKAPDVNVLEWRLKKANAIVLTVAVLDGESRKIVGDCSRLITSLPTPAAADLAAGLLPAKMWQDAVDNVTQFAATAQIPVSVASHIKIYQRSFPLDTLK